MLRASRLARVAAISLAVGLTAGSCGSSEPAVSAEPSGELLLHRGTTRQPPELLVHELSTGNERVVAPAPAATGRWSSDGERVVFAIDTGDGNVEIQIVSAAGDSAPLVVSAPGAEAMPAWSPDCTRIAFARFDLDNDRSDVWVMDADGTNRRQVTTGTGYDTGIDWSPDGSMLAIMSDRGGDAEIVLITVDGNTVDGNTVDGGEERQLTDNTVGDTWPRWSPDGSQIAFARRVNERKQIFVMDASGENELQLTTGTRGGEFPVWSPDGQWIAYEQAGAALTIMRADGSDRTELEVTGVPSDWGPKTATCS